MEAGIASLVAALGGALITGLFGVAFLFLRRKTEREQLNALTIESAVLMFKEQRADHVEDVETIAALRDEIRGLRQDLAALEQRAGHAEQELRARDAQDALAGQIIDRLEREVAELRKRVGE